VKIKVCGMKYPENMSAIAELSPDYLGFIFYEGSKRNMEGILFPKHVSALKDVERVGVFVNKPSAFILEKAAAYGFSFIQLHGDESPEQCLEIKNEGLKVIKAFALNEHFDFRLLEVYKGKCDYFLFDAKGVGYGGNGVTFNWEILKKYDNSVPFFLSGGIDSSSLEEISKLKGLNIHAIDINSRFEVEPGLKDIKKIENFISKLKEYEIYG
jgi:phosphoribosylanthranilate isomerase